MSRKTILNRNDDKSTDESIESNSDCNESEVSIRKKLNNSLNYGSINEVIETTSAAIGTSAVGGEGGAVVKDCNDMKDVLSDPKHSVSSQSKSSRHPRLGFRFSDEIHIHSDTDDNSKDNSIYSNKSDIRFDSNNWCWWTHPQVKRHCKVFLSAFALLVIGISLLIIGVVVTIYPEIGFQSYVFFIAGIICFIPGAYHVVYMYCAVKGKRGYDFHQLPLFH